MLIYYININVINVINIICLFIILIQPRQSSAGLTGELLNCYSAVR